MNETSVVTPGRAAVVETIETEHHALSEVLRLFQHLLGDIAAGHAEPDFELLATSLYYIDDFACRCHHRKEDQDPFTALVRHAPDARTAVNGLNAEHQRDDLFVRALHRLLVLYQAGAPDALKRLSASTNTYAAMLRDHMRREEVLLDAYADAIPDDEWRSMADEFGREDEPMFGPAPQKEFAKLRTRIISMLPTRLRKHPAGHDALEGS